MHLQKTHKKRSWLFHIEPFADYRPFSLVATIALFLLIIIAYFLAASAYFQHCYIAAYPNWALGIITLIGLSIIMAAFLFGHHIATIIDVLLFDIPRFIKKNWRESDECFNRMKDSTKNKMH